MHAYTRKPKATRLISPAGTTKPDRVKFRQIQKVSELNPMLHLQRTIGNQAVQRLLPARAEQRHPNSSATVSPRIAHVDRQNPVFSQAITRLLPLLARQGTSGSAGPLPYFDRIQRAFGAQHDLSKVKAYIGGHAAEASRQLGAEAYANGEQVAFRTTPSLQTAAHEAAHVIQQRSGVTISGGLGTKADVYEQHANAVANRVVAGRSCKNLLGGYTATAGSRSAPPVIQCLGQSLPYVGPLSSYLNPRNQLIRAVLPGLSRSQKSLLDGIFGNSLATSIIRLNPNSLLAAGHCYRTTGNIINMPGSTISDRHLIHEAAHVWQSQNTLFGVGYAVSALKSMAIAQVLGGDWQRAYDYHNVERYRIPWRYWNAEQQANWIEDHRRLPSGWMLQGLLPDLGPLGESSGIE